MKTVICPYCGLPAELADSKEIYGKSYGMIYICRPCDAYVGCHGRGDTPKGTLADAELREWRKKAHRAFDPIWKTGKYRYRRNAAYSWLADMLGLPVEKTHIGMFDVAACKRVIEVCKNERSKQ